MTLLIAEWLWIIGGMIATGEPEEALRGKPVAVPPCWPQILNGLAWDWIQPSISEWLATNHLSHDAVKINPKWTSQCICWAIRGCLQSILFFLDIDITQTFLLSFPFCAFSIIRYMFSYTNQMQPEHSMHICTVPLLHVSVYITPSWGRTYAFLTQNHRLLQSYCLWYIDCVIKCKRYKFVGLQYFYNDYRFCEVCNIIVATVKVL
jgi:hypothetical protein